MYLVLDAYTRESCTKTSITLSHYYSELIIVLSVYNCIVSVTM